MTGPVVDVVIAVHDPARRVDRALSSLADARDRIRATVVCHGLSEAAVADRLPAGSAGWVRTVEFADGVASPAGPFNHGLRLATADYVMIMGSDDYLEPYALGTWIDAAKGRGAAVQLAPLRHQNGEFLANPLTRPWRRHRLDSVRDRLFHRSAPLGLIRRDLAQGEGPLSTGMPVGEDLAWSSALWTSHARIDFDPRHPAYVIGADADARVTMQPRAVEVVLAPVDALIASEWALRQPPAVRASLVAKLLRVNLIGALRSRATVESWSDTARAAVSATLSTLSRYEAHGFDDLPRSDRTLLDVASSPASTADDVVAAIARHRSASRSQRLLPRRLTRAFGRESVLRRYARYTVDRRR